MRSPPKTRNSGSSSDRKKRVEPGSPWCGWNAAASRREEGREGSGGGEDRGVEAAPCLRAVQRVGRPAARLPAYLPPAAAAELVVHSPALVPLRAHHVQAAQPDDLRPRRSSAQRLKTTRLQRRRALHGGSRAGPRLALCVHGRKAERARGRQDRKGGLPHLGLLDLRHGAVLGQHGLGRANERARGRADSRVWRAARGYDPAWRRCCCQGGRRRPHLECLAQLEQLRVLRVALLARHGQPVLRLQLLQLAHAPRAHRLLDRLLSQLLWARCTSGRRTTRQTRRTPAAARDPPGCSPPKALLGQRTSGQ